MTRTVPGATAPAALAAFNSAGPSAAAVDVSACCAAPALVRAIVAGRPYPDLAAVSAAVDAGFARLDWAQVSQALAAHPRIGERSASGWSAREQAGALAASHDVSRELAERNREYEQRFGHVFLICATGLSAEQMLTALRGRLGNDPAAERRVVASELRKITHLRIRKLLGG